MRRREEGQAVMYKKSCARYTIVEKEDGGGWQQRGELPRTREPRE